MLGVPEARCRDGGTNAHLSAIADAAGTPANLDFVTLCICECETQSGAVDRRRYLADDGQRGIAVVVVETCLHMEARDVRGGRREGRHLAGDAAELVAGVLAPRGERVGEALVGHREGE